MCHLVNKIKVLNNYHTNKINTNKLINWCSFLGPKSLVMLIFHFPELPQINYLGLYHPTPKIMASKCFHVSRVGNEPSYSGSARKKLGLGSARELNELSLSLNLGLINLGLGSKKARLWPSGPIRRWNEASAYGFRPTGSRLHRCDPDSGAPE